jgi:Zn-dependent protease
MPIEFTLVQKIAIWALPVIFAITIHEAAHGYAARALGDRTAAMLGRVSLNPLRHIDPVGTVLVPGILLLLGGFLFGWAKPVPVDFRNLRHPRRDMALVALAGPLSNAAMALLWGLLLKFAAPAAAAGEGLWIGLSNMAVAGIVINLILMVLNLLPLPPLDGGRVLTGLVPESLARWLDRIEPYGIFVLFGLLFFGLLGAIMGPGLRLAGQLVFSLLGMPDPGLFNRY